MEHILNIIGTICCGWFAFTAILATIMTISSQISQKKAANAWFEQGKLDRIVEKHQGRHE